MKKYEEFLTPKYILTICLLAILTNAVIYFNLPLLPIDSTWTLSSFYDFLRNPQSHTSSYAHEYMGQIFDFNPLHYLLLPFFKLFTLNTTNFILFHFLLITLTSFFIYRYVNNKTLASLMILAYTLDTYTYGFRSESYLIIIIIAMLQSWQTAKNIWYKTSICIPLTFMIGLIHPVGGIISSLSILYLIIEYYKKTNDEIKTKTILKYLFFSLLLIIILIGITGLKAIEHYIYAYTHLIGEIENHFVGINFELILKYITLGNSLWLIIIGYYSINHRNLAFVIYSLSILLLLIFSGRSYYCIYLIIPALLTLNHISILNLGTANWKLLTIVTLSLAIPLGLTILRLCASFRANEAGLVYKRVIEITKSKINTPLAKQIFIPTSLSIECYQNKNQRILYPTFGLTHNTETPKGSEIFIYSSDQIKWLEKDCNKLVLGNMTKWHCDTLISFNSGQYDLKSAFTKNPIPVNRIGLIKYTKIEN